MLTVTGNGVSFGFLTLASHQCLPRHHEAWRIVALRQTVLCVHLSITSSFTSLGIERRPHDSLIGAWTATCLQILQVCRGPASNPGINTVLVMMERLTAISDVKLEAQKVTERKHIQNNV